MSKRLNREHFIKEVLRQLKAGEITIDETDNQGQVVIYTGWFLHSDGMYYDYPEEKFEEDSLPGSG